MFFTDRENIQSNNNRKSISTIRIVEEQGGDYNIFLAGISNENEKNLLENSIPIQIEESNGGYDFILSGEGSNGDKEDNAFLMEIIWEWKKMTIINYLVMIGIRTSGIPLVVMMMFLDHP